MPDSPVEATFPREGGTGAGQWWPAGNPVGAAVVAHGAGNDLQSPLLQGAAAAMAERGVSTLLFDFPYAQRGRRAPDRPPVLLTAWAAALEEGVRRAEGLPVVAGGKSLGGRMASLLAAEQGEAFRAAGLVFFGYPLHPPGRPERLRDAHLPDVPAPMLFIQGTADPLATFGLVEDVVRRLGPRARLHPVEGGDHSFRVRGARRADFEIGRDIGGVAARFVHDLVRSGVR